MLSLTFERGLRVKTSETLPVDVALYYLIKAETPRTAGQQIFSK